MSVTYKKRYQQYFLFTLPLRAVATPFAHNIIIASKPYPSPELLHLISSCFNLPACGIPGSQSGDTLTRTFSESATDIPGIKPWKLLRPLSARAI